MGIGVCWRGRRCGLVRKFAPFLGILLAEAGFFDSPQTHKPHHASFVRIPLPLWIARSNPEFVALNFTCSIVAEIREVGCRKHSLRHPPRNHDATSPLVEWNQEAYSR